MHAVPPSHVRLEPSASILSPGGSGTRRRAPQLVINSQLLHVVTVPLLMLAALSSGFVVVYLQDVLLPFVIAIFITYLLRPTVNLLTTPFSRMCPCLVVATASARSAAVAVAGGAVRAAASRAGGSAYTRVDASGGGGGGEGSTGAPRAARAESPPRYPGRVPQKLRQHVARAAAAAADIVATAQRMALSSTASLGGAAMAPAGSGERDHTVTPPLSGREAAEEECGCCCGPLRMTRIPRWFAILVSLATAIAVVAGIVILIVDAIVQFERRSLRLYIDQASRLAEELQRLALLIGIHIEANHVVDLIKENIKIIDTVQYFVLFLAQSFGNVLLVLLLVLYLLAESGTVSPGSLRAKVDSQIQRYVVIKTAISGLQGALVYLFLGPFLNVRMSHLFGVFHFLLNFIPTAGPILATFLPLPIVVLDPELSATAKIMAFVGPSLVHLAIGNIMEPIVFGQGMELHPVTVLLALALWYALWGMSGAILAIPITAVLRIIFKSTDHPYAHIVIAVMEGRMSAATGQLGEALDAGAAAAAAAAGGHAGGGVDEEASRPHAASATSEDAVLPDSPPGHTMGGGGGRALAFEGSGAV